MSLGFRLHAERTPNPDSIKWVVGEPLMRDGATAYFTECPAEDVSPLAAVLFGMLYQGGAELAFEKPKISRDMIVVIQALVILFAGALEHMFRPAISRAFAALSGQQLQPVTGAGEGT